MSDFAINRFGWDKSQVDKLLKPVIRALEERGGSRQARLEKYFKSHRVKLPDKGLIFTSNQEVFKSPCCKQSQTLIRISGFELSAHVRQPPHSSPISLQEPPGEKLDPGKNFLIKFCLQVCSSPRL